MNIEIHIFPNTMSLEPGLFQDEMQILMHRISETIGKATVSKGSAALGKITLLDLDDKGYIQATIDIRGS